MLASPIRRLSWSSDLPEAELAAHLTHREWLVSNGIGGYACGSLSEIPTRRFHALLVAALPAPLGRSTLLNRLTDTLRLPNGELIRLGGQDGANGLELFAGGRLAEFRLDGGLPVWLYEVGPYCLEKRVLMVHNQNTTHVRWELVQGEGPVTLQTRAWLDFRLHEGSVIGPTAPARVWSDGDRHEFVSDSVFPPLRTRWLGSEARFVAEAESSELNYLIEQERGYDHKGVQRSPGYFVASLSKGQPATLMASCEPWEVFTGISHDQAVHAEGERRHALLAQAHELAQSGIAAELVLAADQFVIKPVTRVVEHQPGASSEEDERTVIAGYHWFTDWGRDTMISLEGLTLLTGRHGEARRILRTFAHYVRDGLIPNMFPEGKSEGLYHTADASLWFFHAVSRYVQATGDTATLEEILPKLRQMADAHLAGTHFGIGVDPSDGLLKQGQQGYQLTWMDAKVEDWVVTPRRGKAVEINALFYNALCVLEAWLRERGEHADADRYRSAAERARSSFAARFWYAEGGHLYDLVDGEQGDDPACRPNQLFAISLPHPILDREHWSDVLDVCHAKLLTPVGLRSLAPGHPDYKSRYYGDLRSRDAAYHQGTVWGWLIGPFVDTWRKVRPDDHAGLKQVLAGFTSHTSEACIGSVSEIFDADAPFTPRGCVAQAWSVAELLRAYVLLAGG
ncbi:MAG: glycogen debranching protein [Myxococcaceae bacterium]|nr:glycogen debranching protein [Myxococcaceae bacterium]